MQALISRPSCGASGARSERRDCVSVRRSVAACMSVAIAFLACGRSSPASSSCSAVLPAPARDRRRNSMALRLGAASSGCDRGLTSRPVACWSASSAGSALGTTLGLALGAVQAPCGACSSRSLQFFRFIPPIAWLTPVLIWFGIGENGKYVLIIYTTTFMVTLNTLRRRRSAVPAEPAARRALPRGDGGGSSSAYVIVPDHAAFRAQRACASGWATRSRRSSWRRCWRRTKD